MRWQSVSGDTALPRRVESRFARRFLAEPVRSTKSAVALRFPAHSQRVRVIESRHLHNPDVNRCREPGSRCLEKALTSEARDSLLDG